MPTKTRSFSQIAFAISSVFIASSAGIAQAGLVNGDFSVDSLPSRGNSPYSDLDQGWVAKNAFDGTSPDNWRIQPGEYLEQLSNSGTATRAGQFFSASDLTGTGWSLEFDLAVDQSYRVQLFGGVDDGNNNSTETVWSTGDDDSPDDDIVVGNWTTIFDTNPTDNDANNLDPGHIVIPIADDLSLYDVMVLRFRGRTPSVGAQFDNLIFTQVSAAVPEPSTLLLTFAGLIGLAFRRRRK